MKNLAAVFFMLILLAAVLALAWFFPPSPEENGKMASIFNTFFVNASSTASSTSPRVEYKIVDNIDQCELNQYTAQGWLISQMGSVGPISQPDPSCRLGDYDYGIDWAVLEKDY